jgi:hypothetical protein
MEQARGGCGRAAGRAPLEEPAIDTDEMTSVFYAAWFGSEEWQSSVPRRHFGWSAETETNGTFARIEAVSIHDEPQPHSNRRSTIIERVGQPPSGSTHRAPVAKRTNEQNLALRQTNHALHAAQNEQRQPEIQDR